MVILCELESLKRAVRDADLETLGELFA